MTNIKTENRITKLEGCMIEVQKDISEINNNLNNHVNSLTEKIDGIQKTINERPTWLTSLVVSLLLMALGILAGHFLIH
jgi:uncharacterized coiled-coil protein SlyX